MAVVAGAFGAGIGKAPFRRRSPRLAPWPIAGGSRTNALPAAFLQRPRIAAHSDFVAAGKLRERIARNRGNAAPRDEPARESNLSAALDRASRPGGRAFGLPLAESATFGFSRPDQSPGSDAGRCHPRCHTRSTRHLHVS